jgi:hypothetical protein
MSRNPSSRNTSRMSGSVDVAPLASCLYAAVMLASFS